MSELFALHEALAVAGTLCRVEGCGVRVVHRDRLHPGHFYAEWVSDGEGSGPAYNGEGAYESSPFYTVPCVPDAKIPGTDVSVDWKNDKSWMIEPYDFTQIEIVVASIKEAIKRVKERQK